MSTHLIELKIMVGSGTVQTIKVGASEAKARELATWTRNRWADLYPNEKYEIKEVWS